MALNVLHISESDGGGGAAKAARNLHEGLLDRGLASRMLVGSKSSADDAVRPIKRNLAWRALDRPFGAVADRLSLQYAFYPSSFALATDPWVKRADVLQLHNLHGSFFSFSALPKLSRRLPTVWWMQDMWPMTGHAAYTYDCERWLLGCGSCPYLDEYPALKADRTAALWRLKRFAYERSRLTLVISSRWLAERAAASPLLGRFDVRVIANGVDTSLFKPQPRQQARAALGIDVEGPAILAFDGETRKGAKLLPEIFARVAAAGRPATVLIAGERGDWSPPEPLRLVELGRIADQQTLADAYAAADVFLFPTLADNLPNAVLESIACGTPVVSSDVGGVPDMVRPGVTGVLCEAGSAEQFGRALEQLAWDEQRLASLAAGASRTAAEEYDRRLQTQRFVDLYGELTA